MSTTAEHAVLIALEAAAEQPIEELDADVLRAVIDTARDLADRAQVALDGWGPL